MHIIFPEDLDRLYDEIRPYFDDENAPQEIKDKIEYWKKEASRIHKEAQQFFLEMKPTHGFKHRNSE